jgi:hypothetical protein
MMLLRIQWIWIRLIQRKNKHLSLTQETKKIFRAIFIYLNHSNIKNCSKRKLISAKWEWVQAKSLNIRFQNFQTKAKTLFNVLFTKISWKIPLNRINQPLTKKVHQTTNQAVHLSTSSNRNWTFSDSIAIKYKAFLWHRVMKLFRQNKFKTSMRLYQQVNSLIHIQVDKLIYSQFNKPNA